MKIHFLVVLIVSIASVCRSAELPRSNPEAEGVSSAGVLAFIEAADNLDTMNSFMLVRHGRVVAEGWWSPYRASARHSLYSLSKSFTSTAVGLAIAEGKLSVDDEVLKFFPDDAPAEPSNNLKAMRVNGAASARIAAGPPSRPAGKNFTSSSPSETAVINSLAVATPGSARRASIAAAGAWTSQRACSAASSASISSIGCSAGGATGWSRRPRTRSWA